MTERQVINEATLVRHEGDGDVHLTINGPVYIMARGEEEDSELCKVVNRNTMKMTKINVTEDFGKGKLNEPDFCVYPQMRKIRNFFGGGSEKYTDVEIEVKTSRFLRHPHIKVIKNQMRREIGFHYKEREGDDETITIDELMTSFCRTRKSDLNPHEKDPVTAIVASAGSGKTTLLKRIAQRCAESCAEVKQMHEQDNVPVPHARFKMVRYMEMKNIKYSEDTDVATFLFEGLCETAEEQTKSYKWLLKHQSEAVLFFDGLDQATWTIPTQGQRKINEFQRANTAEIMFNLLSRNLLSHVKIAITSREFRISELPAEARPEEIVSLAGLQRKDAEKLFVCLIGDRGPELWKKIQTMARRLLNIISIPVFLVLTAAVTAMDPDKPPPQTITELYNRIMLNLRRVESIREREKIMEIIRKLKAMAHLGMVEGRIVFYESDLKKFGLTIQEARDLMIKVPGSNLLSRFLFEGDFVFFFCHQSLQEFLSASFVAEMSYRRFSQFNEKYLHEERWSVVCCFVSGIIHQPQNSALHEVSDQQKKQKLFDENIRSRVRAERGAVELLGVIYESNNDDLLRSLPTLPHVAYANLGPDGADMFSSIWARRENVTKENVYLRGCGLTDELLDIMLQNLKDRNIRVGMLDLLRNSFTATVLKPFLAQVEADVISIDYKLVKDIRYDDLDWSVSSIYGHCDVIVMNANLQNIRRIHWGKVEMANEEKTITIRLDDVNGCFYKTPKESDMVFYHKS